MKTCFGRYFRCPSTWCGQINIFIHRRNKCKKKQRKVSLQAFTSKHTLIFYSKIISEREGQEKQLLSVVSVSLPVGIELGAAELLTPTHTHTHRGQKFRAEPTAKGMKWTFSCILLESMTVMLITRKCNRKRAVWSFYQSRVTHAKGKCLPTFCL